MTIGQLKYKQSKFAEAIDYFYRSVISFEKYFPTDHIKIVNGLEWIASMKCFLIDEKVLPPDHQDIGKSLCNISITVTNVSINLN
jgi:hypothetical protein